MTTWSQFLTYHSPTKVTQNQTAVQCHVHPYVDKRFVPVIIAFFIIALVVVLLRVAARVVSQATFWYDDYFNLAAFVTVTVYTFTDIASLIRVSILLFYLRIFRTSRDKAIITWTLAVVVLFSFTLLFPIVFQCSPVDYLWLQWDGTRKGHCTNFRVFVWVATSIGIALDFWIVLIACSFVARLQLPLKKKIMVSSMFTVGIVAIAFSIARLPYINQFTGTKNPTIDWVPITIWSALENYIGVICACLPSLPALLRPLSALRIPSSTKRSNLSSHFASQRAQAAEQELERRAHAPIYEMTPTYGRAIDVSHESGAVITGSSPERYHNFLDLERESL
ncbi:hypothetical protein F5B18DRAFT_669686 [Nemania serpens]|nr:hypothetical protein F5B18DRAFT_669686 [Nemania serpens]